MGNTVEQISPKRTEFTMLEQPLPNLSADRLIVIFKEPTFQNFLTREEAQELFLIYI